ncbi:hypothetical protein BJX61DRAFT_509153 [Aspergillus egyptiacus]|nr:hypothetical protein BJX61DRAFT_509153 [Aspergillus egyptiacus]
MVEPARKDRAAVKRSERISKVLSTRGKIGGYLPRRVWDDIPNDSRASCTLPTEYSKQYCAAFHCDTSKGIIRISHISLIAAVVGPLYAMPWTVNCSIPGGVSPSRTDGFQTYSME